MEKHGAVPLGMPERSRGIKFERTVLIHTRRAQGIVGTLHVAPEKQGAPGSGEVAQVEPADEADILAEDAVAVADGQLRLHDGVAASGTVKLGAGPIVEVNIAVVS